MRVGRRVEPRLPRPLSLARRARNLLSLASLSRHDQKTFRTVQPWAGPRVVWIESKKALASWSGCKGVGVSISGTKILESYYFHT
jgi:hypothetical protein